MKKAILGRKLGMTNIFDTDGTLIPVTVIEAGPCVVTQVKTKETDGYDAIQVGFGNIREKLVNKPLKGHYDKTKSEYKRYLREFRIDDIESYNVGDEIKADIFSVGDRVDVAGTSKGKGFTGPIKRWNQAMGPSSHGSRYHRGPGSMGSSATPSRVFKSKKLAGRMGGVRKTVQNLEIVKVDPERDLILIKGSIPGARKGLVYVKETVKR